MSKIHLISGPRNISTALMYSFSRRQHCMVVDEPFYGLYLEKTGLDHPGRREVLAEMSVNEHEVFDLLKAHCEENEEVFVKDMAHHLEFVDQSFFNSWQTVWLIRDPRKMIVSFSKVISRPTIRDLGLKHQWQMFEQSIHGQATLPIVIDSGTFMEHPENGLRALCSALNIGFDSSMLSWPYGAIKEDGVWAPYWYANVHESTGFIRAKNQSSVQVGEGHLSLLDEAMHYYEQLKQYEIG